MVILLIISFLRINQFYVSVLIRLIHSIITIAKIVNNASNITNSKPNQNNSVSKSNKIINVIYCNSNIKDTVNNGGEEIRRKRNRRRRNGIITNIVNK